MCLNSPSGGFRRGKIVKGKIKIKPILMTLLAVAVILTIAGSAMAQPVLKLNLSRLVVLDDPNSGKAGTGFKTPPNTWGTNYWYGEATTIRGYAVIIDSSGGIPGASVTFTIKKPDGSVAYTTTVTTDSTGVASFSYNLNGKNYYGYWTVEASATVNGQTLIASKTFIYNWWGCANCHGKETVSKHGTYSQKSPYTMGIDFHRNPLKGDHSAPMVNGFCTACHQGYDKIPYDQNAYNNKKYIKSAQKTQYSDDIHYGVKKCQDCHANANTGNRRAEIAGCYDTSGCHAQKNTKLTPIDTTTGYSVGGTYRTIYSYDVNTGQPSKAHTATKVVPCLSCHGPAHDISKPVVSGTSNSYTEDSQCLTCHTNQGKHSPDNPVYCTACHSQDAHSIGILDKTAATQPTYTTVGSANAVTKADCESCHSPGAISNFFNSLTSYDSNAYTNNYQPQTDSFGYTIAKHNGVVNCNVCHDDTDFHTIKFLTHSGSYSTDKTQAVSCEDCHVPGVNDAVKSVVQGKGYNPPQVSAKHNNAVPCEVCHSPSPHGGARFLSSDLQTYTTSKANAVKCTDCHANPSASGKTYTTRTGTYTMNPPYLGDNAFQHGNATWEGQNWGSYWTKGDDNSACLFCHASGGTNANAVHSSNALGAVANLDGAKDLSGNWCVQCHVSTKYGNELPVTPPFIDVNNTGKAVNSAGEDWFDHTSLIANGESDNLCKSCHGGVAQTASTVGEFIHQVDEGTNGGPDCVSCHDIGGFAPKHVDVSAMKQSIHANLNSNAVNTTKLTDTIDKACWACHGDGTEPSQHPASYKNPKKCEDCHTGTTQFNAPLVAEHYYAGEDLVVNAACQDCHSKTEMLNTNSDPDSGSVNATISHYGKKRTDLVLNINGDVLTDCYYCHQNTSTAFKNVMQNPNHSYMYDHSDSPNSPKCWNCHSAGRIHDQTHIKPQISNGLCLGCHQSGIGGAKPIPTAHNSTMNCYSCHMDPKDETYDTVTAQIHGIKYISSDGTYSIWDKSNAANCVDCHENLNTSTSLTAWGYTIPAIPKLSHSNDPVAGQKWGNYWTSDIEACNYCHQSEIHKDRTGLLGNVSLVADGAKDLTGTWCANCHYQNSPDYKGDQLNPVPPRIDVDEGTANDGTTWVDHSGFLSSSYTDSVCKQCHGSVAQSATSLKDFVHAVSEGTGGGCISCHENYTGSIGINVSSYGRHVNVNTTDGIGNLTDADCTTCHYDTSKMFDPGWSVATYDCQDCHLNGTPVNVPSDVKLTTFQHGSNDCKSCHVAGGFNSNKYYHWNYSTPYGAVKEPGWPGWTSGKVVKCQDCHYSHSKRDEPFHAPGIGTYMATMYTSCGGGNCHGNGQIHDTVTVPYLSPPIVTVSVSSQYAYVGDTITVTAEVIGYNVQIYNASYRLEHNGVVVQQGQLTPDDGKFGGVDRRGFGYEKFTLNIDTTGFEPGEYRIYITGEKDTGKTSTVFTTFTLSKGGVTPSPTAYNFGFESWTVGSTPVSWTNTSATVFQSPPRSGNVSAGLTSSATGYLESAKFKVTPDASYRVTVYVKKPSDGGYAGISIVQWNGSSIISETPVVKLEGYTSDWVLLGIDIKADRNATNFSIRLYVNGTTAYFDDVNMTITPPITTNYVVNGGFDDDWSTGRPDRYFRGYEYRQSPYESIKAWEPKEIAPNGLDVNTTVAIGKRSAGIYGSGYWTTPYADTSFGTLYRYYQQYYAINLAEGKEFTVQFMIYADRMSGKAGVQFVYRTSTDIGDTAGTPDTYRVVVDTVTDGWLGVITSGKMPVGKQYLQLKLFSEGANHVLFDEVGVY